MPRARALERIARVLVPELERAREIGVPRPRQRDGLGPSRSGSPSGCHGAMPHVQFAWSRLRTTRASGVPRVRPWRSPASTSTSSGLQLLARAPPVALLPAPQVGVEGGAVEPQPGRQPGDDRDEGGAVRLACAEELETHTGKPTAARIAPTGAARPVHSSNEAAPWATSTSSPLTTRAPAARAAAAVAVSG